ncbi:hypothetical protein UMZ34_12680 [Halopseudomonas pachastrellae]|nr:hypothetical protein UMZ34_12680 [Halopseudomonas pachastrellae]
MSKPLPRWRRNLLSFSAMIGFFLLWEVLCRLLGVSELVLPVPSQIAAVLIEKMPILWPHTPANADDHAGRLLSGGIHRPADRRDHRLLAGRLRHLLSTAGWAFPVFPRSPWCRSLWSGLARAPSRRF